MAAGAHSPFRISDHGFHGNDHGYYRGIASAISFRWKENSQKRWWLKWLAWLTPAGFIAVEAGWIVTEVGRQPWIIYGILKTSESVTPMPGIQYSFYLVTFIYLSPVICCFLVDETTDRCIACGDIK